MKKLTLAAGLLAVAGVGSVGCKTTPKLAWWKPNAAAESTAVAHTAPALPSDLAKQSPMAGATTHATPGQVVRTASTVGAMGAPASYPTTDAPPFTADVASRITSAPMPPSPSPSIPTIPTTSPTSTAATHSAANLGSIAATPYNPALTPSPTTTTPSMATAPIPGPRYGMTAATAATTPTYGQPASGSYATAPVGGGGASTPTAGAGSSYVDATSMAPRYSPVASTPVLPSAGAGAGGYANGFANTTVGADGASTGQYDVTGGATAATAAPYRPGGTGTYPTQPPVQVASRPQAATVTPAPTPGSVPNVGRPGDAGSATFPQTAPTTTTPTRYW